jgi:hypothetical protein
MANTWVANASAVAHASGKSMMALFNATGTAKTVKAYLFYLFNNGTGAVTGVLTAFAIRRLTAASVGTTVTPVAFDTASAALDANTTARHNGTVTPSDIFRRFVFSNEEPTATGSGFNNLELLVPFAEWGRYGVDSSSLDPIVCNSNQGVDIAQTGSSAVGTADPEIIFTST